MALSFEKTGKFTSERHEAAKQNGKLTAGEAAKRITKITGEKVTATDLKPFATEWHHSGFYKAAKGSTMGRTYFFTTEQVEKIAENWQSLKSEQIEKQKKQIEIEDHKRNSITFGFYFVWDYDYSGSYGKKRNFKVLKFYQGNELSKPKNFTSLTAEEFEMAKHNENKKYYGWDEPIKSELLK